MATTATPTKKAPAKAPAKASAKPVAPKKIVEPKVTRKAATPAAKPAIVTPPVVTPIKSEPPKPVVFTPCDVTASWAEWIDATKRAVFTGRRHIMPILTAAYITTEAGSVVMRSTDLELFSQTAMSSAYMDGSGPLLVNSRALLEALNGVKGALSGSQANCARVSVIRDKIGSITVSGFGRNLQLTEADMPADDYPAWPSKAMAPAADLVSGAFVDLFGFAFTAAGRDDTLPMLTGIQVSAAKASGPVVFAATDRYRLAVAELPIQAQPFEMLVPYTAWPVLKSLTGRVAVTREVGKKPTMAGFRSGNVMVLVRLLDATFPPYKSLLPTDGATWQVERKQLIGDVLAAAAVKGGHEPIHITFGTGKYQVDGCELHVAHGTPLGTESWRSGFNPAYLLAGLRSFDSDDVTVRGTTATKPYVLQGERHNRPMTYLIMPVRLPG